MKPYYQDDHVTIYHGDCLEMLPELPNHDVLLTDPPYGMNYVSNYRIGGNPFGEIAGDKDFDYEVINRFLENCRVGGYVFGRWENLPQMPNPKSVIVWVKNNHSMGDLKHEYGRRWEMCAFYALKNHSWANGRPKDVVQCSRVNPLGLVHPTEKPIDLLAKILADCLCDSVLDPFAGSGTTGRAAKNLGKKATLIELEERYCEIAAKRMAQECFQFEEVPA